MNLVPPLAFWTGVLLLAYHYGGVLWLGVACIVMGIVLGVIRGIDEDER